VIDQSTIIGWYDPLHQIKVGEIEHMLHI